MSLYNAAAFLGKHRIWLWNENNLLRFAAPKGVIDAAAKKLLTQYRDSLATAIDKQKSARCLIAPCSKNQNSLWYVQQIAPESPAYNVAVSFQMKNGCTPDVFI